jgi:hypothetical protein
MRPWKAPRIPLLLLAISTLAAAQAPLLIDFQGKLLYANGTAVSGTLSVTFRIYNQSSGGTALWSETQSVNVQNGFFDALLGGATSLSVVPFNQTLFLSVQAGSSEMAPRLNFTSAPYAGSIITGGSTARAFSANRTGFVFSTTWTTIPGLDITFNLERPALVQWTANGVMRHATITATNCHQSFRAEVDGVARGHLSHGERLNVLRGDLAWWNMWTLSSHAFLPAGSHTVRIQTRESSQTSPICYVCSEGDGLLSPYSMCDLNIIAVYS